MRWGSRTFWGGLGCWQQSCCGDSLWQCLAPGSSSIGQGCREAPGAWWVLCWHPELGKNSGDPSCASGAGAGQAAGAVSSVSCFMKGTESAGGGGRKGGSGVLFLF